MQQFVLGVDIGGTNIKLGLINRSGRVIIRTNLSTKGFDSNKNKLIDAVVRQSQLILEKKRLKNRDILGIGIGLPGLVDTKRGLVHYLVNIRGWNNVPLKKIIERKIRISTFIDNDVNVITLGEWKFGAGRGLKNLICLTLGTGVGGGLVIENRLYRGPGFSAGEIGHIPLNEKGPSCACGGYGCLERAIGNKHLLQKAKRIFDKDISLEDVSRLASRGHKGALSFWKETAVHLGNGLVGIVNVLNPSRIIIGGGIANAHQFMFKVIYETISRRAMKIPARMVKIVKAELGADAGIIGAQVLVSDSLP